ncbi:MAG: TerC family protein [Terriglobia bacterium]
MQAEIGLQTPSPQKGERLKGSRGSAYLFSVYQGRTHCHRSQDRIPMNHDLVLWGGFTLFVLMLLGIDLGVFHRRAHIVNLKEALLWCCFWVGLALVFNLGIYYWRGPVKAMEFLTGYLIEEALSVDNLFVFLMIFSYFRVDRRYQHRVLFWGILGAILMRACFIVMGISLIRRFHWIIFVFGGLLIFTGIKMAFQKEKELHPEKNPLLRLCHRWLPITKDYVGGKFFTRREGRVTATPLFVVLLLLETTDLAFAVDSIPAVLAISHDPFIVYTSNIFAILGLRSIFFALSGIIQLFAYLQYGLSAILIFVGLKMVFSDLWKIPVGTALAVVGGILLISIVASLIWKPAGEKASTQIPLERERDESS